MTQYLMLFTITPVQSFISQARKTQDLYGGSGLLSKLVDEAVSSLPNKTLLFPSKKTATKPNRFLAEVETDDINKIGREIEDKLKTKLEEFFSIALKNAGVKNSASFISRIADIFQVFWAAVPHSSKYHDDYLRVEKLLAGVKNLRSFKQQSGVGRKCSVCGEREVIFCAAYNISKERLSLKPDRNNLSEEEKKEADTFNNSIQEIAGWKIAKGEGLCTLCFTKRFCEREDFPSTASISLMNTLQTLEKDTEANKVLERYKGFFNRYHFDEQLYYEENLTEPYFDKNGFNGSKNKLPEIRELQKKINGNAKDKGLRLNKYYAIVRLDGDDMGRWFSGEFLKDKRNLKNFHLFFSERFGDYAEKVKNEIKEKKGRLVYAGGDDLLAFINLKHLFPVLESLKDNFPTLEDAAVKKGKIASSSSGIVIAHYKTPLSEVLNWSQRMQEEAKTVDGKDAVAIAFMTHSGNMVRLVCKSTHITLLKNFTEAIQNNFSDKFVFSMKTEMLPLFERSKWRYGEQEYVYNIILTELKRLLIRSKKEHLSKEEATNIIADTLLDTSFQDFISFNIKNNPTGFEFDVHNFSALLEAARFMAKETGSDS